MEYLLAIVIGYGFGCFQTGYLVGKFILKQDIRDLGNGNSGASNATMVFGKRFGFVTVLIDIVKTILAVMVVRALFGEVALLAYLAGLFVIIGHNFPFYMKFRGGKGTASLVGLLLAIDVRLGLLSIVTIFVATLITDYIALGTFVLLGVFLIHTLMYEFTIGILAIVIVIIGMSVHKHYPNIVKIKKNGTETSVKATLFKKNKE